MRLELDAKIEPGDKREAMGEDEEECCEIPGRCKRQRRGKEDDRVLFSDLYGANIEKDKGHFCLKMLKFCVPWAWNESF
ncbi:hypothetical protein D8674_017420 [Pyrus ussuriensis x Pyrus communis]|uniref:Uncharacterized protein n=1 Tax=Pyrus ussuriensis x Pyrus communis TaxID=2448454 RepID=A0A5N5HJT0_9ROSA|nr:hypothetical protein D8674_017420 [Pyrus ussuriensis x Pyrus communis]